MGRVLSLGASGDDVKMLQAVLNYHRTPLDVVLTVDGTFGGSTKTRVVSFQTQNQLTPDGIVGATTRSLLMTVCRCAATYEVEYPPPISGLDEEGESETTTEYTLSGGVQLDLSPWERPPAKLHYKLEFEVAWVIKNPQLPGQLTFAVGTELGASPPTPSLDSTAVYAGSSKVLSKYEIDFEAGPIKLDAGIQSGFEVDHQSGTASVAAAASVVGGMSFTVVNDHFYLFAEGELGASLSLSGSVQASPQLEGVAGLKLTF